MADQVWVLAYHNTSDEVDNGVLGVYATEDLARDAAIVEAKKDPNLERFKVKWKNEDTLIYGPDSGLWYEVRPYYYVNRWDVQGYLNDRQKGNRDAPEAEPRTEPEPATRPTP